MEVAADVGFNLGEYNGQHGSPTIVAMEVAADVGFNLSARLRSYGAIRVATEVVVDVGFNLRTVAPIEWQGI